MPTRRGWGMVGGCLAVIVLGRLLGLLDLYVVGLAGLLLVAAAVGWVRFTPVKLEATRRLRPQRVPVGGTVSVEVSLHNVSRHRTPVLDACDSFDAGRFGADWLVAPLAAGETGRTRYKLPTDRRGVFGVGPLEVELRDPFGLALVRLQVLASTTLTVLPLVEVIAPPPRGLVGGAQGGARRPSSRSQSGDDFYALRPYSAGDDLRRVHWPSTARRGEIMIRQNDHPWQDRTTVLLDARTTTPAALESAVSAAASVLSAASGDLVRLVCSVVSTSSVGTRASPAAPSPVTSDSGYGLGPTHLSTMLDTLAAVRAEPTEQSGEAHFPQALHRLRDAPGGGTVVVVTSAAVGRADMDRIAALSPKFAPALLVTIGSGIQQAGRGPGVDRNVRVVRLAVGQPFSSAWRDAAGNGRSRAARRSVSTPGPEGPR